MTRRPEFEALRHLAQPPSKAAIGRKEVTRTKRYAWHRSHLKRSGMGMKGLGRRGRASIGQRR